MRVRSALSAVAVGHLPAKTSPVRLDRAIERGEKRPLMIKLNFNP
jgi:hypothetical protein